MAAKKSSDSFNTPFVFLVAVVVVVGSAFGGYYLAGGLKQQTPGATTTAPPSQPVAPASVASAPPSPPMVQVSKVPNDFTAPDAPPIAIHEEKTPTIRTAAPPPVDSTLSTTPDSEASQEDAPPATPTANDDTSDGTNDDNTAVPTVGAVPSPVTGDATTPTTTPSTTAQQPSDGADPDYEQTDNGDAAEPTQSAATPQPSPTPSATTPASPETPSPAAAVPPPVAKRAHYRVEVGSFEKVASARSLADALRNRGYSTTTVAERRGDETIYHVQAGAFHSRSAADQASTDLQTQGFPAYVAALNQ